MSDIKIGQLIEGVVQRDAIHMAVAPVKAANLMNPGQHCGISKHGLAIDTEPFVGIVDPFLNAPVKPGDTFWLWLYPGSIKGLRHSWHHPSFPEQEAVPVMNQESVKWLTDFAVGIDMSYAELIDGCVAYLKIGDGIECLKMEWKEPPEGFWDHFQAATGMVVHDKDATPFACCI